MAEIGILEAMRLRFASWLLPKSVGDDVRQMISAQNLRRPPHRGTAELLAAYKVSPWLHAVVKKISTRFSAVPWRLFVELDRNGNPQMSRLPTMDFDERQETIMAAASSGRLVHVKDWGDRDRYLQPFRKQIETGGVLVEIERHLLLHLLRFGNPMLNGMKGRELTSKYSELKGEVFWILESNTAGAPVEFWPIPPHWVQEIATPARPRYEISINSARFDVAERDVVWFKDPDPADPYGRGVGLGESLGDEIETDEYAAKMTKMFFLNRGKPELLVAIEGAGNDSVKQAKQEFLNQHRGYNRAHGSFWHSGKMTVKELQTKFTDMELTDLRAWERDMMFQTWGMPPELMGIIENSNRATIHAAESIFARSVLVPRLEDFRETNQTQLVPLYDERLILDYDSPIPEDREFILSTLKANPHSATRGEWRELQGLQHRGEVDEVHYVPSKLNEVRVTEEERPTPETPDVGGDDDATEPALDDPYPDPAALPEATDP